MKFKKHIFLTILLISSVIGFAQPGKAPKEKINGKEYYIHTVESGTTLYGLSKMYGVTIDEITAANPGTEAVLGVGDKLKIPVKTEGAVSTSNTLHTTDTPQTGDEYLTHKVARGETVSVIARKYNVSLADIYNLNPGSDRGIKENQVLKIKKKETTGVVPAVSNGDTSKTEYKHIVSGGETLYNLSKRFRISVDSIQLLNGGLPDGLKTGDTIHLLISKNLAKKFQNAIQASNHTTNNGEITSLTMKKNAIPESDKKDKYSIGLFLPFFLDKNQKMLESKSSTTDELTYLYEATRQSMDFYHGVLYALDSLKGAGLSVQLNVYDTWNDTARINSIIKKEEFKNLDLIIGPTDFIEPVARAAKAYGIPLVCPFTYTNKIMYNNPYVSKATTSLSVIIEETTEYIVSKYGKKKIFVLDGKDKKDDAAVEAYKKALNEKLKEKGYTTDSVKYIKMETASYKNFLGSIGRKDTSIFIIPSNDVVFVSQLLSNMNNLTNQWNGKDYYFTVFGTDEWVKMDGIDVNYKVKFNVHVPSPVHVDFDDTSTINRFIKGFRNKYKTDPDRYAMMGFDISYFFMAGYLESGKNFINHLEQYDVNMVNTRFKFKQVAEGSGFLNTHVFILEYEDYKLVKRK